MHCKIVIRLEAQLDGDVFVLRSCLHESWKGALMRFLKGDLKACGLLANLSFHQEFELATKYQ